MRYWHRMLFLLVAVLCVGCVTLKTEDPVDPDKDTAKLMGWGRTSALNQTETVTTIEEDVTTTIVTETQIVCSSGITGVFAEMLCGLGSVTGGVFGSTGASCSDITQMKECAGLLQQGESDEEEGE